ncbi:hypothetical protein BJY52DRAFT_690095 [Lactarius psammicola]|nr:hypothetical protein BJY52DRAFT_690095 [Lactarius psammicola]
MGQKLALAALSFPYCQPLNGSHIRLGWYDRPKPNKMASYLSDAMDMSSPRDGNEWGSPLTVIDSEGSVSNTTLVRPGTPPRVDRDSGKPSGLPPSIELAAAAVTESSKRKRTYIFDGVAPPARKRKATSKPALISLNPDPTPEPVTSVNDEEAQAPQPTPTTLESILLLAITRIETLTTILGEQNKRIEQLVQDNTHLRDELTSLSRTFQISKRDLQRVENTIPKLTTELKTKFEKMLEKTEGRIQGPIDRLLEELGRIRASPPTPVHVSSITTFPQNTQFVPESQAEGESSWTPSEDYNPPRLNKQHYQEKCEPPVQPPPQNNSYARGSFRHFRGRARWPRGGYVGNRHGSFYPRSFGPPLPEGYEIVRVAPPASIPAAAPLEQAQTPLLTPATAPAPTPAPVPALAPTSIPAPTPAPTPQGGDSYHSQGPPPSQRPHTYSQSYPRSHAHPPAPAPAHYDADPPNPSHPSQRYRPARVLACDRTRDREPDRESSPPPPPPPLPVPPSPAAAHETYTDRAQTRARSCSPSYVEYRDRDERPAPPPRPRSPSYVEYRDQERPRARSEAADDAYRDDGGRYAVDSSVRYSPVRSDEQQQPQQQQQQRWASSSGVAERACGTPSASLLSRPSTSSTSSGSGNSTSSNSSDGSGGGGCEAAATAQLGAGAQARVEAM